MAVSGESLHHGLEGAGLESRTFSGHYWQARGNTAVVIGRRRGGSEWHCKALWWPAGGGKGKRRQVTWSVCSSESGGWQYHWWKAVRGWFESGEDSSRLWLGGELREEGDWSSEGPWARPLSTSTGVDKTASEVTANSTPWFQEWGWGCKCRLGSEGKLTVLSDLRGSNRSTSSNRRQESPFQKCWQMALQPFFTPGTSHIPKAIKSLSPGSFNKSDSFHWAEMDFPENSTHGL